MILLLHLRLLRLRPLLHWSVRRVPSWMVLIFMELFLQWRRGRDKPDGPSKLGMCQCCLGLKPLDELLWFHLRRRLDFRLLVSGFLCSELRRVHGKVRHDRFPLH